MKRLLSVLICLFLLLSFSACAETEKQTETTSENATTQATEATAENETTPEPTESPLEITILANCMMYTKNGLDVNESEEKLIWDEIANTNITFITPPAAEFVDKMSIMFASGDLPDVAPFSADGDTGYTKFADYLIDLSAFAESNLEFSEIVEPDIVDLYTMDGKLYCFPTIDDMTNKFGFMMRKDWLDNLGMEMPETLEDYEAVLNAFTFDDPDGNGQADTYGGTFRSSFDWKGFLGAFDIDAHEKVTYDVVDGNLVPQQTQQKYKDYLEYFRKLWLQGVFTPDSMVNTSDQWKYEMFNGVAGTWYHANTRIDEYFMTQIKTVQGEDTNWELCAPISPLGSDGTGGQPQYLKTNIAYGITTAADEPQRIFDYFVWTFTSEEALDFAKYGIEGKHYEVVDGKKQWIEGITATDEFRQIKEIPYLRWSVSFGDDVVVAATYGERALENYKMNEKYNRKSYTVLLGKPELQAEKDNPDLDSTVLEYTMKIISGEYGLDKFDEMIEMLNNAGLAEVTAARQQWYDETHK